MPTATMETACNHWRSNRESYLSELKEFLAIPSISALSEHRQDVAAAADFVAAKLRAIGLNDVAIQAGRNDEHPLVLGQWLGAPGKPTVLLYAHYDVQPVDPLDKWISPPFTPEVRNGKLYARGSADDKGHLWLLLAALDGLMKTTGRLPVNVKILFEGEEEYTGAHIERFISGKSSYLDGVTSALLLDSGMFAAGLPTICTGLRGIITSEITVRGAASDLHSGEYGGAAPNPLQAIAEIIAGLKTPDGRVVIPGFYDDVREPSPAEKDSWKDLPFDEGSYTRDMGAPGLSGDTRYPVLDRLWARPTVEVNGIAGGFAGEGFKTVIPAEAQAKVSMRLVPEMDPDKVAQAFKDLIERLSPAYVHTDVQILSASPAMVIDTSEPAIQCAAAAFQESFGAQTAYVRGGGSIPIAGCMRAVMNVPILITGFALPDSNCHAPNENLDIDSFYKGIEAVGRYLEHLSKQ